MSEEELNKLPLGSKWSVDERCVRVARVPPRIDVDELSFFFRDFNLAPDGIEKIPMYVDLVVGTLRKPHFSLDIPPGMHVAWVGVLQ